MSKGINLIASDKKAQTPLAPLLKKMKTARLIAVVVLFGVSVASVMLFILISFSPLSELKKQESSDLTKLSKYHTDMMKIKIINERLSTVSDVLKKRRDYEKVIASLRSKMPKGVAITSLTVNKESISVSISSSSLSLIDKFLSALVDSTETKKEYSRVVLSSLSKEDSRGGFLLSLEIGAP